MAAREIKGIRGIIFDMDGTLVDSEINTEKSVLWLLKKKDLNSENLDLRQFHGITWQSISTILKEHFPALGELNVKDQLQEKFHELFMNEDLPYIPGAQNAIKNAIASVPTSITTSSNRESVEFLAKKMEISDKLNLILSAEDYQKSKPDPECYLLSAKRLGVPAGNCVVFEDSIPGLKAGKAAGMFTVAITQNAIQLDEVKKYSDLMIQNYLELPKVFFTDICL